MARDRESPSTSAPRIIGGAAAGIAVWAALAFVADWALDLLELWNQPEWIARTIFSAVDFGVALVGLGVALVAAGFVNLNGFARYVVPAAVALGVLTAVSVLFGFLDLYDWETTPLIVGMTIASIVIFGRATDRRGPGWFFPPLFTGIGLLVVFTVLTRSFDWVGYYGQTSIVLASTTVAGLLAATILATRDSGPVATTTPAPAMAGAAPAPLYYDQHGLPVVVAAAAPSTNGLAIASLILGLCGLGVPAVVCGHIALSQIRRSGGVQEGRGIAIGGLVAGYIAIALVVALWIAMLALS